MTNVVNWSLEMTKANLEKINKVNEILIPGYSEAGDTGKTAKGSSGSKGSGPSGSGSKGLKLADIKDAAKEAKSEHGQEFVTDCVVSVGGNGDTTPAKQLSSIDKSEYKEFMNLLKAGPVETGDNDDGFGEDFDDEEREDFDDDDFDDDEPEEATVDTVKAALKAYKEENGIDAAKKILTKHGALPIKNIDSLSKKKLQALFNALS